MVDLRAAVVYPYATLRTGRLFVPILLSAALPLAVVRLVAVFGGDAVAPYRALVATAVSVVGAAYYVGIQGRAYRRVLARDESRVRLSDRSAIRADAAKLFPVVAAGFALPVYTLAAAGADPVAVVAALGDGDLAGAVPAGGGSPLALVGVVTAVAAGYVVPAALGGLGEGATLNRRFVGRRLLPVLRTLPYAAFWLAATVTALAGVAVVAAVLAALSTVVPSGRPLAVLVLLGVLPATYVVTGASVVAAQGYRRGREQVVENEPQESGTAW